MSKSKSWRIRHFSLANPRGRGRDDVAQLLRRVADQLDERQPVEVQDIVFHTEISDEGKNVPSMTVYFHKPSDQA